MLIVMKAFTTLALFASVAFTAPLNNIKTIYLFPMSGSYEQFLANRITGQHLFQIVADPSVADAVLTDRLDASFEHTFDQRVLGKPSSGDSTHSSFNRARGTLFLVTRNKQVAWSTYVPSKGTSARALERAARHAVGNLKSALVSKPPAA